MEDGLLGLLGLAWTVAFGVAALAHVRAAFSKDNVPLRLVVLASVLEAEARRHRRVKLLHFVLAITCDPEVATRLARIGSIDDLRERLDAALGPNGDDGEAPTAPPPRLAGDPAIEQIIHRLARKRRRSPTPAQYLTALLDALAADDALAPDVASIFEAFGLTRASFTQLPKAKEKDEELPPSLPYRGPEPAHADRVVRIWNDDKTTQEMVVELLTGTFGRAPSEARYLMIRTHHTGSSTFGPFSVHDAERLAAAATTRARDAGFPLRITVEPPPKPEKKSFFAQILGR